MGGCIGSSHRFETEWRLIALTYSKCNIQGSPDDWAVESGKMRAIYRHAAVTISASDSKDCHDGLFFRREAPKELILGSTKRGLKLYGRLFNRQPRSEQTNVHSSGPMHRSEALHDRAWTFQERYLAIRTVHFAKYELGWSCPSMEPCECEDAIRDS